MHIATIDLKIYAPNWNDELDLPDGSNSILDIKDYFEYIIKKHEIITDKSPIKVYINRIKIVLYLRLKQAIG